jgi:hypothetical protein
MLKVLCVGMLLLVGLSESAFSNSCFCRCTNGEHKTIYSNLWDFDSETCANSCTNFCEKRTHDVSSSEVRD